MRAALKAMQAAAGGGAVGAEPREATFSDVVLLIDSDGTNGGDNDDISDTDGSANSFFKQGTQWQGSFSPYGDNWSVFFDASNSSYLRSSNAGAVVQEGDFTLECWALSQDDTQTAVLFDTRGGSGNNKPVLTLNNGAFSYWSTSHRITASDVATEGVWYHVAIVRRNNTTTLYIDGVSQGTYSDSANMGSTTRYQLGADDDGSPTIFFDGYISNARFSTTSKYTSDFTPSTSPLTVDSTVKHLACSSNRFKDESGSNATFTVSGTPKVSPISPFTDTSARTLTNNGGSIQFPSTGNGNLLYTSQTIATDTSFSVEGWVYMTANPTESAGITGFWSTGDSLSNVNYGPSFGPDSSRRLRLRWWLGYGAECAGSVAMNLFEWNHIHLTIFGSGIYFFINGVRDTSLSGTTSYSSPIGSSSYDSVGADNYGKFRGYISDLRVSSSAQRTSNFTPPTSPASAFGSSKYLLNFRDAQIIDLTGLHNIRTSGAEVNSNSKFGSGSVQFGNGDYLEIPSSDELAMRTGDFTIECWAYVFSTLQNYGSQDGVIIETRATGGTSNGFVFNCRPDGGSGFKLNFYTNGSANVGTTTLAYTTWHHLAVTRESGTIRLFVNGAIDKEFTKTNDFSDTPDVRIGTSNLYSSSTFMGRLDDLRITRGVARYISAFTPPTAALDKF